MKNKLAKLPVWMELKLVLSPEEYSELRSRARVESQNVAELVKHLVRQYLKSEAGRA